jgi:pilus assembly protein Flp/PilA
MLQMITAFIADRLNREEGATMVEYGLLVALIAVVVAIAATVLGQGVSDLFTRVDGSLK